MRSRGPSLLVMITALVVLLSIPAAVWASHQFRDVPDGHLFHDDIGWLAENQVTLGCNPPDNDLFCPDEGVTRGQMAAFMRRLAEGRVVDAATVGGGLGGAFSVAAPLETDIPSEEGVSLATTSVRIPGDGTLTLTGEIFFHLSFAHVGSVWTEIDDGTCDVDENRPESSMTVYGTHVSNQFFGLGGGAATWVLPVDAGRHWVDLCFYSEIAQTGSVYTGGITGTWGPGNIGTGQGSASEATVSELLSEHG